MRTLIPQVWIPAAVSWVRRDQPGVSTPQTTYLFDMCLHAKIITLASNQKKKKRSSFCKQSELAYAAEQLSSSVLTNGRYNGTPVPMTMSLTLTLQCQKGTLQ